MICVGATVTVHQFFCILHFCHTCDLCRVELVVQFPARGSTQVLLCLFLMRCGCGTSYIVSVHIKWQASIYTLSLCRGHSWQVRLAKQETLTPSGHLVSPLVCRGPWMSTVVLYCWCHSDGALVLLFFTLQYWLMYHLDIIRLLETGDEANFAFYAVFGFHISCTIMRICNCILC